MSSVFPYFGSKQKASMLIFETAQAILGGAPAQVIDPFCGSLGTWLDWPNGPAFKLNDLNGFIVNFWRMVKADPGELAKHLDYPFCEVDLEAQLRILRETESGLVDRLRSNIDYYDASLAIAFIFLDPPYENTESVYTGKQKTTSISDDVLQWCLDFKQDKRRAEITQGKFVLVALCAYQTDRAIALLDHGWHKTEWKPKNGMCGSNVIKNRVETIYWSGPIIRNQINLFGE